MMRVSFPIMGNSYVAFKQLIRDIGHEPILAPMPSARTMTLGTANSPEFACIPFKILMGTYLEAIEKGAEVILASGGHGPCRAGYYGILHEKIIRDLGYNTEIIVFDSIAQTFGDFVGKLHWLVKRGRSSWWQLYKAARICWSKLDVLDQIERTALDIRPYEITKGITSKVYHKCLKIMEETQSNSQVMEAKEACLQLLNDISQDRSRNPLKIGIVGEIYVLIEPFANLDIQATLGEMGVYTERMTHLSNWTKENTNMSHHEHKVTQAALPYLRQMIGGHGIHSVGETVLFSERGFDGVIQVAPFSCIPEIVAKGIMPKISKDRKIPVMTVFMDEQTGKAGLQTRLEAFVDLLRQQQQKSIGGAVL